MNLRRYFLTHSLDEVKILAEKCETSLGNLRNISHGYRACLPDLARRLEKNTGYEITKEEACFPELDRVKLEVKKKAVYRADRPKKTEKTQLVTLSMIDGD